MWKGASAPFCLSSGLSAKISCDHSVDFHLHRTLELIYRLGAQVKPLRLIFFSMLCLFVGNVVSAAENSVDRGYTLPGHGKLLLHVPTGWDDEVRKHPGDFPPTIYLSGFEGSPFVVMITPLWPSHHSASEFGTPKSVHDIVARAAQAAAPESVEGKLNIVTMGGGQGPGYYFDATDRAPKPGDFKYMTQGAVGVGVLVCTFTVLTNDEKSVVKDKVLTMLSRAAWRPGD